MEILYIPGIGCVKFFQKITEREKGGCTTEELLLEDVRGAPLLEANRLDVDSILLGYRKKIELLKHL